MYMKPRKQTYGDKNLVGKNSYRTTLQGAKSSGLTPCKKMCIIKYSIYTCTISAGKAKSFTGFLFGV